MPSGSFGTALPTELPMDDSPPIKPPIKLLAASFPRENNLVASGGAKGVLATSVKADSPP
eukprot:CAMPEP_0173110090 /NCGR_PEP_ID=MMETSP1102-20130122/44044_1 /TAXON_ID=49646 /ORGANISM="Geminigera sp., Strain Caron Lab Isolate" /LENGTH=59 /DNA_ID=CAMNT_0014009561 /DNA_START=13 /DNA_END=189 /DNA_ORIENTATION=-